MHRGGFLPVEDSFAELLSSGSFLGDHDQFIGTRIYPPVIQEGRAGDPQTHSNRLRELDGLLCCHRTPGYSSMGK